jgi:DNA-binding MarR family transcriptional regulator
MSVYNQLKLLLLNSGLSEAEALAYADLLKNGPAENMTDLIRRTRLARSTAYHVLEQLKYRGIVSKGSGPLKALSLKSLVDELQRTQRRSQKTIHKLRQISPFLHVPEFSVDDFEVLHNLDDIKNAYMFMAEHDYDTNLDFGDYESFICALGDASLGFRFREKRAAHATHHAICTTFGPNLKEFCSDEDLVTFRNRFDMMSDLSFKDKWIIFSDNSDYVMFNDTSDPDFPTSVLLRSKIIADVQRMQFENFSKLL